MTIKSHLVIKSGDAMPKSYSEQERAYIKRRLKEEAAICPAKYGIRHTTVDELVQRVNIPKGTFYLFYASKELLLFDVILEQHEAMEQQIYHAVHELASTKFTAKQLTDLFVQFYKTAEDYPVLRMITSGEVELLARKLPPEVLAAHLTHDTSRVEQLFAALFPHSAVTMDTDAVTAAFRAIYFSTLHQEEIGKEHFEDALRLLVGGIISQLSGGVQ